MISDCITFAQVEKSISSGIDINFIIMLFDKKNKRPSRFSSCIKVESLAWRRIDLIIVGENVLSLVITPALLTSIPLCKLLQCVTSRASPERIYGSINSSQILFSR